MKWTIGAFVLAAALAPLYAAASSVSVEQGASTYEASSPLAPTVRNIAPLPGETVKAFFPRFSATIDTHGAPMRRQSLRLYVDGQNVTSSTQFDGNTVAYLPRRHLKAGWHDAFLQGSDTANHTFSQAWVFRSESPDVDDPITGDGGFAFLPVGLDDGPFSHFFLISPFDGFGSVQLCNFSVPLHRAGRSPVFFVTVPATLGTTLLGCNPGLLFTPFAAGLGELTPIFFPIEIAGPGIFQGNNGHHHRHPMPAAGMQSPYGAPLYRTAPAMSVYPAPRSLPVYRTTMPTTTINGMPVMRMPGTRIPATRMPSSGMPIMGKPAAVSVPHPYIPH